MWKETPNSVYPAAKLAKEWGRLSQDWHLGAIPAMSLENWRPVFVDLVYKKEPKCVKIATSWISSSKTPVANLAAHVTCVCAELAIAYMKVLVRCHALFVEDDK